MSDGDPVDEVVEAVSLHVYPTGGREHKLSKECWCHPTPDPDEPNVWVHSHGPN